MLKTRLDWDLSDMLYLMTEDIHPSVSKEAELKIEEWNKVNEILNSTNNMLISINWLFININQYLICII